MFARQLIKRLPTAGMRNLAIRTLSTIPPHQKSEVHMRTLDPPTQEAPLPTVANPKPIIQQEDLWTKTARIKFIDFLEVALASVLGFIAVIFITVLAISYPMLFIIALILFALV